MLKSKLLLFLALPVLCCCRQQTSYQQAEPPTADSIYSYKKPASDAIGKVYLGREIARVVSISGGGWLERDTRAKEENVKLAVKYLPLTDTSQVADIGAGTGFYTFRIAPQVKKGKVYAIEIQDDAIDYLKKRSQELKLKNVDVVKGNAKSPNLPANSIDLALMVDVYHELEFPHEYLQSLHTALKPNGKIVLLEYRGEDPDLQIKEHHKTTAAQITKELTANGFTFVEDKSGLPLQHFLIYQKK